MVKLLNSQPLELAVKLKAEIRREQEAIGGYDMSFYAQMANELLNNVFRTKDEEIEQKEIKLSAEAEKVEEVKAPVVEE
jgi:hypothetical protein